MHKIILTLCLVFGAVAQSQAEEGLSLTAGESTYKMGAIERSEGGRIYRLHLNHGEVRSVRLSAFSSIATAKSNEKAKIKFYSIKFFNGVKTV